MPVKRRGAEINFDKTWDQLVDTIYLSHKLMKLPFPEWLDLKIQDFSGESEYEKLLSLLLSDKESRECVVTKWSKYYEKRTGISNKIYFSEFQLYLWRMLDDDTVYNMCLELPLPWKYCNDISFLSNYYNHCRYLAKNIYKREKKTRKAIMNSNLTDFHQRESYTPDYKHSIQYKTYEIKCENAEIEKERSAISKPDKLSISEMCNRGYKNEYNDIDLIASITQLECSEADKKILIGLATGEIEKKDIPVVLGWSNRNDRKKLSRYVGKLKLLLSDVI